MDEKCFGLSPHGWWKNEAVIPLFQHQPTKKSFFAIINLNDVELDEIVTESFSQITEEITKSDDEESSGDESTTNDIEL